MPAPDTGAVWFKSSHSGGEGNECVEVADLRTCVAVRDSKWTEGPVLRFGAREFGAFVAEVKKAG
ncbi:DUF397 domain-containing protein [Streptomyces sp. MST-110588]|nr:DUF397 domain-containing protein [Streptomyces sp. MST-110588]